MFGFPKTADGFFPGAGKKNGTLAEIQGRLPLGTPGTQRFFA